MGKGDKKTRRGKITMGTFGVRRPRKRNKPLVVISTKKKPKAPAAKPKVAAKPKAKTTAKPKTTTKAKAEAKPKAKAAAKK
jgi:30S ribosomal protein S31